MKYLAIIFLPLLMIGCSSGNKSGSAEASAKFEENLTIGKSLSATRFDDVYFSAQPSDEDIKALKAQGFAHIVNLRTKTEYDEKHERELATKSGLSYTFAAFKKDKPIKEKYLDYITMRIGKHRSKGKTLVHCSSGNRTAAWAAIHFFRDHGYSQESAIALATKIGLEDADLMAKVKEYTAKKEETPAEAVEASETPSDVKTMDEASDAAEDEE